jgi:acid phosphatase (class A)
MKKLFILFAAAMMTAMLYAGAPEIYIEAEQLPRLLYIMPAPPSFNSPEFAYDEVRYNWGKEQRQDSSRLATAIADAEWNNLEVVLSRWQEAFGMPISEKSTPHIYALLVNSITTVDPMRIEPKAFYHRQRPFERYGDTMPSHEESFLRGEGSYPSGHSLRGWLIGLVLAQVAPERAEAILARSWDYCNSRVIVGAHWQSDVDNSRTAASAGFCALQASNRFRSQLLKAQHEYQMRRADAILK